MSIFFKGAVLLVGSLFFTLLGCNRAGTAVDTSSIAGDYSYELQGDTIALALRVDKDSVYGELKYVFSGKDTNSGHINGNYKDSLITAEYNFVSEGIPSVREIVFLLTPEGLLEGYGEVEEKDEKMIFSDKNNLSFDHGMLLKKK